MQKKEGRTEKENKKSFNNGCSSYTPDPNLSPSPTLNSNFHFSSYRSCFLPSSFAHNTVIALVLALVPYIAFLFDLGDAFLLTHGLMISYILNSFNFKSGEANYHKGKVHDDNFNGVVALVIVVLCLEVRVVYHSFRRNIQVPLLLNYLLVTLTMFGGAVGAGADALGLIFDTLSSIAFISISKAKQVGSKLVNLKIIPELRNT
ncbi:hypothetical protein RCOM_0052540 [Ricinus communis]|uniref:Uncharacterized protein n=1 Tax=Ricinus communis TaxID=3988 RepID=B9T5G0_RICCO|nr:hypothetical protein RCOM_0052540 [Ricinus communis]